MWQEFLLFPIYRQGWKKDGSHRDSLQRLQQYCFTVPNRRELKTMAKVKTTFDLAHLCTRTWWTSKREQKLKWIARLMLNRWSSWEESCKLKHSVGLVNLEINQGSNYIGLCRLYPVRDLAGQGWNYSTGLTEKHLSKGLCPGCTHGYRIQ